ncbi:phosphoglycerate dehydrogenase [Piscinibacter gummiphilus]|uniref:D-3-phosphoglycerate dehydrogenase n=1 Tax=Piscinibacter gummiphilus TaxID=946333 RepID=A0A1W6L2M9_9BURK|nr:phosphoglycerate dehydrogenase [Piscinibacter gummiphilus]ARN18555.1 D-3-phosphoglycerate dehydrogenase [Piscinibacter gummiphilus]ATU63183.1 phosphoglycerate dehydrogenase [Piscinibacter gummiphilus]GLS95505.1 D-3-phosphoglycerate dehydrogenase [Piscinibacter gummiphilus]
MTPRLSVPKEKLKFVLLEGIHPSAVEALKQDGYSNIVTSPKALAGDELRETLADAHFLGIRSRTFLTAEVFAAAPKLTAVGCFCIGTNQVDLDAAMHRGIPVFNAPFSNTRSVAELVLAELILLMRGIPEKNAILHRNGWVKSAANSYEVRGKTLGIVGYGHIGTQIGVLAEHLGMSVVFHDIEAKLPLGNARQAPNLDALLQQADVVSLHVPETPQTQDMIGAAQIARMKPGSHLINASRGTVVDIDALTAALESKHLHGAAIDVFPVEPTGNDAVFTSPLTRFDNVILTPHIGGSTAEAQANIGKEVAAKLIRYSNNGSTTSAVNFPDVALPEHAGRSRLLHIHRNVPGVMARVNERLSSAGINIAAQYLRTNDDVGYVVIDVEDATRSAALDALCQVPDTIRCRVLY